MEVNSLLKTNELIIPRKVLDLQVLLLYIYTLLRVNVIDAITFLLLPLCCRHLPTQAVTPYKGCFIRQENSIWGQQSKTLMI